MNNYQKFALVSALSFSLSGCLIVAGDRDWSDSDWEQRQSENRKAISNLSLKMSRLKVMDELGVPSFSEGFVKAGKEYQVLYYRTQKTKSDGETTKDETTPLVFKDNKLVGWGSEALEKIR